jgi:SAM-dependent methyltransferase
MQYMTDSVIPRALPQPRLYQEALTVHGDSPAAVLWPRGRQALRSKALTQHFSIAGFSVLDFGCGLGHLKDDLDQRFADYRYIGADVVPEFVQAVRDKHPTATVHLIRNYTELVESVDHIVVSGTFNLVDGYSSAEYLAYILGALKYLFGICQVSLAVNFMTDRVDFMRPPIDLAAESGERYRPYYPSPTSQGRLRMVHASNHRRFKGTNYLIEAVDPLKEEGVDLELVLVERVTNREALNFYRSADIIFDQCQMGNYGYFALEAMTIGKPVMCLISKPDGYLLQPEECPITNTHVMTLKDDIRQLVARRGELGEIGRRGLSYIEKHFSLEAFAGRLKHAYQDLGVTI